MTETPITTFRISTELLAKLDAYAAELSSATGLRVSRNAAVVKLLTDALAQQRKPSRKGGR